MLGDIDENLHSPVFWVKGIYSVVLMTVIKGNHSFYLFSLEMMLDDKVISMYCQHLL